MRIVSGRLTDLTEAHQQRLASYRYEVFVRKLGWKLQTQPEFELDQFDHNNARYVLAENDNGAINGCARLLPTTQPYLLSEVFAELLDGQEKPCRNDIWELSRFAAVDIQPLDSKNLQQGGNYATDFLKAVMEYAKSFGVSQFVSVTPTPVARLLRQRGMYVEMIALPQVRDNLVLAACRMTL